MLLSDIPIATLNMCFLSYVHLMWVWLELHDVYLNFIQLWKWYGKELIDFENDIRGPKLIQWNIFGMTKLLTYMGLVITLAPSWATMDEFTKTSQSPSMYMVTHLNRTHMFD